jgi:hypothetical protein
LRTAGFTEIVATEVTAEYRSTQQRWIDATERHAEAIRHAVGSDTFDDRIRSLHQTQQAITDGVLSRFQYCAVR